MGKRPRVKWRGHDNSVLWEPADLQLLCPSALPHKLVDSEGGLSSPEKTNGEGAPVLKKAKVVVAAAKPQVYKPSQ
eukprot:45795-Eustigmatos_ZCMA.PRE.1